ncbi:MAG: hypothetical protein WAM26_11645, partial [Nitrososphaeraceae archaeon]
FIILMVNMSEINVGYSQIMPTSSRDIKNSTTSNQMQTENVTSNQPVIKSQQNTTSSTSISGSSLNNSSLNNSSLNNSSSTTATNSENASNAQSTVPQVKITSLTKGQKVPLGTLSINGVSSDNPSSICDVYVLLNGIKPYQRVTPMGQGDSNNSTKDFSLWRFTFLPTYEVIAEGDNKMTAKITCMNGSGNATKFNSLNVTGVFSSATNSNTSIPGPAKPLQGAGNSSTNNLSPVKPNSTSLMSTYSPTENVQQSPTGGGLTPQTNYYGITPSSPLSRDIPPQNSSFAQQEEQEPTNTLSFLGDKDLSSEQRDSADKVSEQTQKAVDNFISRVQDKVEERLKEAISDRTPFELVTPTPFDSSDDDD